MGVDPDIEIKQAKIEEIDDDFLLKEAELKKHLEAELEKIDGNGNGNEKGKEKESKSLDEEDILSSGNVQKDYQLRSAMSILRALIIVK